MNEVDGQALVGVAQTSDMQTEDIIREVADDILFEDLDWSPLVTYMSQIHGTIQFTTGRFKFEWQEDVADKPFVYCTTGIASGAAGATQVINLTTSDIRVGNRYWDSINKQAVQVTAVSGASITIKRVPLTLGALALTGTVPSPALLVSLGNHVVEGAFYTLPTSQTPSFKFNYVHNIMQEVSVTRLLAEEQTYHGSDFEYNKMVKLRQFRSDQERLVLFGVGFSESMTQTREDGASWTGTSLGSSGLDEMIPSSQRQGYSGTLDEATLDDFLRDITWASRLSGNTEKMALCGRNVLSAISGFAKNRLKTEPVEGATAYGLKINKYVHGLGTLYLMEEREFRDNPAYEDSMWVIDPDPKVMNLMQRGPNFTRVEPRQFTEQPLIGVRYASVFGLRVRGAAHKLSALEHQ